MKRKNKVIIIAEAGVNHNGKLSIAKKLIKEASKAGADYVKFQTYYLDSLIIKKADPTIYQKKNLKKKISQYDILKKYRLKDEWYKDLIYYSKKNKIKFISSPFDIRSIEFLKKFKLDYIKVPSGEINNLPYLKVLAKTKKKIILSTGMSDLKEIKTAINILKKEGLSKKNLNILHCHSDYPSKPKNLNLKSIILLKKELGMSIGYSDHSLGIEAPVIAVAYGAKIIEKHLTSNKNYYGPDHKASIEPQEFKKMVKAIRVAEKMLGSNIKKPSIIELKNRKLVRKSIVAIKDIKRGEKFSLKNISTKRPALGKSPMNFDSFLKKRANKDYIKDEFI